MRDFGYSKRADETLALWGHDDALADVVWVIRTFQPDVIITRFDEKPPNHGHHTASAILAREAFAAAADPQRFPEQLHGGVTVWQATRLVHNFPPWNGAPTVPALKLDIGAYDPRLGLGMGELAARSRSQHKSQGFGVPEQRGPIIEFFVPLAGKPAMTDILDGIDVSWARLGATSYARAIADAQRTLERDHPERAIPALVRAAAELDKVAESPRAHDAKIQLAEIIAGAAGVYARATSPRPVGVPGTSVEVNVELAARGSAVTAQRIEVTGAAAVTGSALATATTKPTTIQAAIATTAAPSLAYWLAAAPSPGHYNVVDPKLVGMPRTPAPLEATIDLAIGGRTIRLVRPVVHAWTDPVQGERERPFVIVPPATVTPLRDAVMAPGRAGPLDLRVRAGRDAVVGTVELALPAGWTATPASRSIDLAKTDDEVIVHFDVKPGPKAEPGVVTPSVKVGDTAWSLRQDVIDYPHIPLQIVLRPATVRVVPLALHIPEGRIAYIRGSGDSIAADLAHVGFTIDELDDTALRTGDLSRYTAVVIGIRAFNTRPAVHAAHARLTSYAEHGGTVVVQYNTLGDGPVADLGPFPIELGHDRITDETAKPTFLAPNDGVMVRPNKLDLADFDGWVQERGLYFATKWDPKYKPLIRFSDPGESPLDGAIVVAQVGKGRYIYTGLALFRQLPAGVAGAYRLFANLIGGGK